MVRKPPGDQVDQLGAGGAEVDVADRLVMQELDGIAVVRDPFHDELVPDPGPHVRPGVGVRLPGVSQQRVHARTPGLDITVGGPAQRIQVREGLSLDGLRTMDMPEVRQPQVDLVLGVAVGVERDDMQPGDVELNESKNCSQSSTDTRESTLLTANLPSFAFPMLSGAANRETHRQG